MDLKLPDNTIPIELGHQFKSFVSGEQNPERFTIRYYMNEDQGVVYAQVVFGEKAQGPPGHAHGGAISAIFDELMGVCCWVNGHPAMTAQYTTRFMKPVPIQTDFLFTARIHEVEDNKIILKTRLLDAESNGYAEAKGLFIRQDMSTFEKMSRMKADAPEHFGGFTEIRTEIKE